MNLFSILHEYFSSFLHETSSIEERPESHEKAFSNCFNIRAKLRVILAHLSLFWTLIPPWAECFIDHKCKACATVRWGRVYGNSLETPRYLVHRAVQRHLHAWIQNTFSVEKSAHLAANSERHAWLVLSAKQTAPISAESNHSWRKYGVSDFKLDGILRPRDASGSTCVS